MELKHAQNFPDHWMQELLDSQAARKGGVLRRRVRDVERIMGLSQFLQQLQQRGFQVVRNGEQLVIFCNQLPIRRLL